jgi:cytochrome c556
MRSVRILLIVALSLGSIAAIAQADVIAERRQVFKAMGETGTAIGKMVRAEAPFDLAVVQEGLRKIAQHSKTLPKLFPPESATGDTKALPAIWADKAKFDALFAKLDADATAALGTVKDEASLRAAAPRVFANCGACHTDFRAK